VVRILINGLAGITCDISQSVARLVNDGLALPPLFTTTLLPKSAAASGLVSSKGIASWSFLNDFVSFKCVYTTERCEKNSINWGASARIVSGLVFSVVILIASGDSEYNDDTASMFMVFFKFKLPLRSFGIPHQLVPVSPFVYVRFPSKCKV